MFYPKDIRIFFNIIMTFCLFTSVSSYANQHVNDDLISLSFHQVETSVILQALADHRNMNLIIEEQIENKHTIKLNNIDWHKALTIITKSVRLQAEIDGNLLIIRKEPDQQWLLEQKIRQLKEQELERPLIYHSLKINHAEIKSLLSMIYEQKMLSDRGKIFIDERTNTLVIHDIKQYIVNIDSLVTNLDKAIPQVRIVAYIVTMSSESIAELGVKWGYTGSSSQLIDHFGINLGVVNASASVGFNIAKRFGNLLNLELSALEAENQLEIIASPNLLTSHLHTASIKQGTEIPYEVSSGSNGATSIEFKQAVLGLEVTPRVLKNEQLELTLYITQNTVGRSIKRNDSGEVLAIDTQEIRTRVLVNNGETLILGGIFQQNSAKDERSVPGISSIPIIGSIFKYRGHKLQKRELVIFITPQLVDL